MSDVVDVYDKDEFVLVTYTGEFNVEAANRTIDRALQACKEFGKTRLLLDCKNMIGALSVFDRFQVAEYGQKLQGTMSKVAMVRPESQDPSDKFTETVAVNRGVNLKLFTDFEEAVKWLKA
jgi:hypothetical protein